MALLAGLVVLEGALARAYVVRGTAWHLLLHSSIGFGLGLAAGGLVAAGRDRPTRGLAWAVAGQVVSVTPDVLFLYLRLPHQRWMDVFVGHISIHTGPQPLLVGVGMFLLGGWAWWLAGEGRPIPAQLSEYQQQLRAQHIPDSAWWCR